MRKTDSWEWAVRVKQWDSYDPTAYFTLNDRRKQEL